MIKNRGRGTFGGEGDLSNTPLLHQIYSYKLCGCWTTSLPGFFKRCSVGSKTDSSSFMIYNFSVFFHLYLHLSGGTLFIHVILPLLLVHFLLIHKVPMDNRCFSNFKEWQISAFQKKEVATQLSSVELYKIEPLNMFYDIRNHLHFAICIGGRNQKDFLS